MLAAESWDVPPGVKRSPRVARIATIVRPAVATRASRDRGTTRIGHLELLAALCPLAESVIGKQRREPVASCRYDAFLFVRDMRARVEPATGTAHGRLRSLQAAALRAPATRPPCPPGLLVTVATLRKTPRC